MKLSGFPLGVVILIANLISYVHPEDRPAGNKGCESHIDGVLWNFCETTFCPVLSK